MTPKKVWKVTLAPTAATEQTAGVRTSTRRTMIEAKYDANSTYRITNRFASDKDKDKDKDKEHGAREQS